jgi:hypothetical protein
MLFSIHLGEVRRGRAIAGNSQRKFALGAGSITRVENGSDLHRDLGAHRNFRHVGHGVALQVKLAALPLHGRKARTQGGLDAVVVVADDELDAAQPALHQAREELAPMHFRLGQRDAHTQDGSLAIVSHTDRRQHRTADD